MRKGLFTPSEGGGESRKYQRTSDKYHRKIVISHSLSLGVNTAQETSVCNKVVQKYGNLKNNNKFTLQ